MMPHTNYQFTELIDILIELILINVFNIKNKHLYNLLFIEHSEMILKASYVRNCTGYLNNDHREPVQVRCHAICTFNPDNLVANTPDNLSK